ncbi:MAG: aspartate aminotransferase family protein [Alphaproteobacteria bacterium]|nr:MAG: aspartate aminotransferase family protein [Alphaproteobacteria bacterium]
MLRDNNKRSRPGIKKGNPMTTTRSAFPEGGQNWPELQREIRNRAAGDLDWEHGRTPLFVFRNDQETYEIGRNAYFECFSENALGRKRAFFGIASMERDVLDYGLSLFNAPESGEGAFTTGGTESIFIAMKAAREAYRHKHPEMRGQILNIVVPITVHPAFDKAADAMDLEILRAPLREDKRVDVAEMKKLVNEKTIALVGSAPCFPHGVVDPIDELSAVALEADVWLHVDACVGGWIAPFFTRIGRPTPHFDFRYEGVRSISADLHKFGFCPKPASTVFYRAADDLERATFKSDSWPNGPFATPTLVGTRPGGAVAGAWAVLNHLGTKGYEDAARRLGEMTDRYCEGILEIEGMELWAKPDLSLINYGSNDFDIFLVSEKMVARGWLSGLTRRPKGMHAMMSLLHDASRDEFLSDLHECVEIARKSPKIEAKIEAKY